MTIVATRFESGRVIDALGNGAMACRRAHGAATRRSHTLCAGRVACGGGPHPRGVRGAVARGAVEALLEPGDALFFPADWAHHIESRGDLSVALSLREVDGALVGT